MIPVNSDFMLDAVCLAAFSKSDDAKETLSAILEIYQEAKKKTPDVLDKDLDVFFDIIQDVTTRDADLSKKAEINRTIIKLKKSPLAQKDPLIVDQMINLLSNSDDISDRRITRLLHRMSNWVAMAKSMGIIWKMQKRGNQFNPSDDMTNDLILTDIAEYARDLVKSAESGFGLSETIDMVDMTDPAGIMRCLDNYQNKRKSNVFPTGLKKLNKMLGEDLGFKRGEFWAFAASSHNYKSQMLMSVARWCTTLGHVDIAPGMTPCVVLISLENEVPENTRHLVERAYINAYHEEPPKDMDTMRLVEMVARYYNGNGMKFLMFRKDENFGYSDFVKLMESLKNKGLEVVAVILDYITLMRVDEDSDNPAKRLQKLAQKIYNFGQRNNVLIVTGLQLDSKADELNSSGQTNVVKSYGAAHLGDCKGFRRELTGLIFMYIERNTNEVPYLTLCWSKHRDEPPPPKEDRYCAYRFRGNVLGIMDDLYLDKDLSVTDIYSDNEGVSPEDDPEVSFQQQLGISTEKPQETQEIEAPKQEVTEPSVVESTEAPNEDDSYDPFAA